MAWLEQHWQRLTPVSALLYPLSLMFRGAITVRRAAYSTHLAKTVRLPVPVVVVGNITVGGTGKTPLVLWVADFLAQNGMRPGIISRGYGSAVHAAREVLPTAGPASVGDEPLLLAQRSNCPVWIGADRVAAARGLIDANPDCNVIVSDDGLQHYRLGRKVEIAVIDGARGLGNGLLLPAGPLREPPSRLREVDAVVIHGAPRPIDRKKNAVNMRLEGREFRSLLNPEHVVGPEHFQGQRVHAVAGIGHPPRFFAHLEALGLTFEAHAFPDHHAYTGHDFAFADADVVLMTEKDAVKCASFASEKHWALRVDAVPDPQLGELILKKLTT